MKKLFFLLLSVQLAFASSAQTLKSGEPVNDSVKKTEKNYYKITVPKNKSLHVNLTKLKADIDLYIKKGNEVRLRLNDCYSSNSNTENEECILNNEGESSEYSILVYGFKESSYQLKATIKESKNIPILTDKAVHDFVKHKESRHYKLSMKKGDITIVTLSDLSADADLRIKFGRKAGLHTFDCKSTNGGTKTDECSITAKKDGTLYVQVYGYKAAKYKIKATSPDNNPANLVKDICTKQIKNKHIICTEKFNRAYYLTEDDFYGYYQLQVFDTQEQQWKEISKKWFEYNYEPTIKKLENTPLILVVTYYPHSSNSHIYYSHPETGTLTELLSFSDDDSFDVDSIETIDNGKKLSVKMHHNGSGERFDAIYDISNLPKTPLIK